MHKADSLKLRLRLLVISVVCCSLTGVAYGFGMYLFPMVMPEMLAELNLSYTDAGVITGAGQLAPLLTIPFTGYLYRRIDSLRLIVGCQIVGAILLLLLSFTRGFHTLLLLILLLRGWPMMVWIPLISITTEYFDLKWRATVLTTASATACFFIFINGLLSSFFLEHYNWRSLWQLVAVICLIIAIVCWLCLKWVNSWGNGIVTKEKAKGSYSELFRWYTTRSGFSVFLLFATIGLSFVPFQMYLAPHLRDNLNVGLKSTAIMWSVMGICGMFGGMSMGLVTDRFGVKISLLLVFSMAIISSVMLCLPIKFIYILIMAILFGIAQATIYGLGPSYISKVMAPESAALAFSSATMVMVIASISGNFLAGWYGGYFGSFLGVYILMGILFLLGVLFTFGLKSEKN